jgi:hypothetical protein
MEAFDEANRKYEELESVLLDGSFLEDLVGMTLPAQKTQYAHLVGAVRKALDERNTALKTAQDELRQKVTLNITQERGPEGAPSLLNAGPFKVTSVTFRSFDEGDLERLAKEEGIYERMFELTQMNKDGKDEKLVERVLKVNYLGLYSWLKNNGFQKIIDIAYKEKEGTPQVKGPKTLAFIGDKKAEK